MLPTFLMLAALCYQKTYHLRPEFLLSNYCTVEQINFIRGSRPTQYIAYCQCY